MLSAYEIMVKGKNETTYVKVLVRCLAHSSYPVHVH